MLNIWRCCYRLYMLFVIFDWSYYKFKDIHCIPCIPSFLGDDVMMLPQHIHCMIKFRKLIFSSWNIWRRVFFSGGQGLGSIISSMRKEFIYVLDVRHLCTNQQQSLTLVVGGQHSLMGFLVPSTGLYDPISQL